MENVVQLADWKKKKERAARPVLLPRQIVVRMSDAVASDLETIAENSNETVSEIVRQLIAEGLFVPAEPIREAIKEINKIGVNINQISKAINSAGMNATLQQHILPALADLRCAAAELRKCLS